MSTTNVNEDLLRMIFNRQAELMHRFDIIEDQNIGPIPHGVFDLNDRAAQRRLKEFAWRITEEVGEAMNCLKNNPWKQTLKPTDEIHFFEELIDGFHFYIEMLIHCGFTPESLVAAYMDKSDVNLQRISTRR